MQLTSLVVDFDSDFNFSPLSPFIQFNSFLINLLQGVPHHLLDIVPPTEGPYCIFLMVDSISRNVLLYFEVVTAKPKSKNKIVFHG